MAGRVIDESGAPVDDEPRDDDAPVALDDVEVAEALVFTTTPDEDAADVEVKATVFELDGQRYRAFRPKQTVMVILLAATSRGAALAEQCQAVLTWLDHCLDPVAQMQLQNRLYDRNDNLQFEDLVDVMLGLMDRWDAEATAALSREERRSREKALAAAARAESRSAAPAA